MKLLETKELTLAIDGAINKVAQARLANLMQETIYKGGEVPKGSELANLVNIVRVNTQRDLELNN